MAGVSSVSLGDLEIFINMIESLPRLKGQDFVWSDNSVTAMLKVLEEFKIEPKGKHIN